LALYRNARLKRLLREILKKKLKIGPVESLVFSKTNKKKGKVVIIVEVDGKVIIRNYGRNKKRNAYVILKR